MKEVKIQDRDEKVEQIRMMLNMCEVGAGYVTTDIILECINLYDKLGGGATIEDVTKLYFELKNKWDKYFEEQEKNK